MNAKYGDGKIYINVQLPENGIVDKPYNTLWGDPSPQFAKQLVLQKDGVEYTLLENTPFILSSPTKQETRPDMASTPSSFNMGERINVVYSINTMNTPDYIYILTSQLRDFADSGLYTNAQIHVQITCNPNQDVKGDVLRILPNAKVEVYHINKYEYYGIRKVWELRNTPGLTLYFHSKGITHITNPTVDNCRTYTERVLFYNLIGRWRDVLRVYNTFKSIQIVTSLSSSSGVAWFNYWWVRNSYVRDNCKMPIPVNNKYYYEGWIAHGQELFHCDDCDYNRNCSKCRKDNKMPVVFNNMTFNCNAATRFNIFGNVNIGSYCEGEVELYLKNYGIPKYNQCGSDFFSYN